MIGRKVATSVPNVNVRITIAAPIPITSLISVAGTDSFLAELASGGRLEAGGLRRVRGRVHDVLDLLGR